MAERDCVMCHEPFYASRRERKCPDCVGERHEGDLVSDLGRSEAHRLHQGLKAIHRAGR